MEVDLTLSDRLVDPIKEGYEAALTEALSTGRLVRILPDYDGPSRPMHLLYAADQRMTPKLRHFIDDIVATFA